MKHFTHFYLVIILFEMIIHQSKSEANECVNDMPQSYIQEFYQNNYLNETVATTFNEFSTAEHLKIRIQGDNSASSSGLLPIFLRRNKFISRNVSKCSQYLSYDEYGEDIYSHYYSINELIYHDDDNNRNEIMYDHLNCEWKNQPLPGLESLEISYSNINNIYWNSFSQLDTTCIRSLNLSHNNIVNIELAAIDTAYFKAIEILDLSYNNLTQIKGVSVGIFPKLTELYLQNNNIILFQYIPFIHNKYLDSTLNKIRILDLSNNYFNEKTLILPISTSVMTHLDISFNNFRFDSKFIQKIPSSITNLNLGGNPSIELTADVFPKLVLFSLKLSNLNISTLPKDVFRGLTISDTLDLSHNQIQSLDANSFAGLGKLNKLDLSHNQLSFISHGVFDYFVLLQNLDLSFNNFSTLNVGGFFTLSALRNINLDGNHWGCEKLTRMILDFKLVRVDVKEGQLLQNSTNSAHQVQGIECYEEMHENLTTYKMKDIVNQINNSLIVEVSKLKEFIDENKVPLNHSLHLQNLNNTVNRLDSTLNQSVASLQSNMQKELSRLQKYVDEKLNHRTTKLENYGDIFKEFNETISNEKRKLADFLKLMKETIAKNPKPTTINEVTKDGKNDELENLKKYYDNEFSDLKAQVKKELFLLKLNDVRNNSLPWKERHMEPPVEKEINKNKTIDSKFENLNQTQIVHLLSEIQSKLKINSINIDKLAKEIQNLTLNQTEIRNTFESEVDKLTTYFFRNINRETFLNKADNTQNIQAKIDALITRLDKQQTNIQNNKKSEDDEKQTVLFLWKQLEKQQKNYEDEVRLRSNSPSSLTGVYSFLFLITLCLGFGLGYVVVKWRQLKKADAQGESISMT